MPAEVETNGWVTLLSAITGVVAFVAGIISSVYFRGTDRATSDGRMEGSVAAWRAAIEARVSAIEARKDRIDDMLRQVPTRTEMKEDLDRVRFDMSTESASMRNEMREGLKSLGLQISQISQMLYENRNHSSKSN